MAGNSLRLFRKARAQQAKWARAHEKRQHVSVLAAAKARLRPRPEQTLTEWMEAELRLPKEVTTASSPRVRLYAYQRGIADAISDPSLERVSIIKSARAGMTTIVVGAMGYRADRSGGNILLVQPTVDDAAGFGRDQLVPILRASPRLNELFPPERSRDKSQTLRRKEYRGGTVYMVGANSGTGFRRILASWILLDEVDAYPPSAGDDGDPIKLAEQRGVTAWDRKIVAVSTPLVASRSRIESMFLAGDQRRFHVPCPSCDHPDHLVFSERADGVGHHMEWPDDEPEKAHFVCSDKGCVIEERDKDSMVSAGEWVAGAAADGHASFHIWAAYSPHPKSRWGTIAREFNEAQAAGPEQLKVFVNTVLGETWKAQGDAPDWEALQLRAEDYPIGTVPDGVEFITAGVDVGKDRLIYEVVGWDFERRSWSVDAGVLMGAPSDPGTWRQLDELLDREWPGPGGNHRIAKLAIDSQYATQEVYGWVRKHRAGRRVIAVKGSTHARVPIGTPKKVDCTVRGRLLKRGALYRPVGVDLLKEEFYGWLHMSRGEGDTPPGWCRFPRHDREYWRQITGEHLVTVVKKGGYEDHAWEKIPGRENHGLDCRIYARAAAAHHGVDRARVSSAPVQRATPVEPAPIPRAVERAESRPARGRGGKRRFFDKPFSLTRRR